MSCNVLFCNALQCNVTKRFDARRDERLSFNAMYNAMQCMQCNAMQCNAVRCNAMQAMQCNETQRNASFDLWSVLRPRPLRRRVPRPLALVVSYNAQRAPAPTCNVM